MKRNYDNYKSGKKNKRITKRVITVENNDYFWTAEGLEGYTGIEIKLFIKPGEPKVKRKPLHFGIGKHSNGKLMVATPGIIKSIILLGLNAGWIHFEETEEKFHFDAHDKNVEDFMNKITTSATTITY